MSVFNIHIATKLSVSQVEQILAKAQLAAEDHVLQFAGTVVPNDAWLLFQSGHALIVDVRTDEERRFVGYVPHTLHLAWAEGMALKRNPHFIENLEKIASKDQLVLLLCRSGKRSAAAANAAFNAGFQQVYNIQGGFEGDLDEQDHRGGFNGWRFSQLPWKQE